MRRIYESDALARDDEQSFTPHERNRKEEPQSFRSLNAAAWSDRFLPHGVRCRAVSVTLTLPRTEFRQGESVPFHILMKNHIPIPVTIRTASPLLWSWSIDGHEEASKITLREPPSETARFHFDRGERIRFQKEWSQMFRVDTREWEPAPPGEYTLRVEIHADTDTEYNLSDEITFEIRP